MSKAEKIARLIAKRITDMDPNTQVLIGPFYKVPNMDQTYQVDPDEVKPLWHHFVALAHDIIAMTPDLVSDDDPIIIDHPTPEPELTARQQFRFNNGLD